jgi:hypothetical protein
MLFRKAVTIAATASLIYVAPSVVPMAPFTSTANAVGCVSMLTFGSAFAGAAPCGPAVVFSNGHSPVPWGVISTVAGVVSIMINAAIVWNTQCRELTLSEAMTANAIPGVGIAINQSNAPKSLCPPGR